MHFTANKVTTSQVFQASLLAIFAQPKLHQCYCWPVSFTTPRHNVIFAAQKSRHFFQILEKLRGRVHVMVSPSINFPFCICAKDANPCTGNHYRKHSCFFAFLFEAFRSKVRYGSILHTKHKHSVELLAFSSMPRETVNTITCCDGLVSSPHGNLFFNFTGF